METFIKVIENSTIKWFYNLKVMKNFYNGNWKLHLLLYQIYKCHTSIGLWCQFCRWSMMSILPLVHDVNFVTTSSTLSPYHQVRYLVLNLIGPWCQFCHHIITSSICFDWNLFVLSLIWVNQKRRWNRYSQPYTMDKNTENC